MSRLWNNQTSNLSDVRDQATDGDSLKMIPAWSIVVAVCVFALSMWWFNHGPVPMHRRPGSLPMHLIMGYTTGTALASYALLVGYVSRDVKRRNMPAALWMLIVVIMPGGIEAVELIRAHKPDVVFLDVQMPGLDGFAVLKKLLDKKTGLPQVVFATAFDQYAVRAFEVNAVDYLLKPFDRKRLLKTIDKVRARLVAPLETNG